MTQNIILSALSAAGVSVWLDDLSRDRLTSGNLQQLIDTRSVVGVTTNPSIFQHAISHGQAYTRQLTELAERGADADSAIRTVITDDVRRACDVLRPHWEASRGVDGRVSIEVDPRLAHDTDATVSQAVELWKIVDRPNLFIKIPATTAGYAGHHRHSGRRHLSQRDAHLLRRASPPGDGLPTWPDWKPLKTPGGTSPESIPWHRCSSPASIPKSTSGLEAIGTDAAMALRGQAAIANARLAYAAYQDVFEAGHATPHSATPAPRCSGRCGHPPG